MCIVPKFEMQLADGVPPTKESFANLSAGRRSPTTLFAWLISHQPTVLFSHNKPATSNQPAVLFSQNKPAPAISYQPTEQALELPTHQRPSKYNVFYFPATPPHNY
jgi:hypothetical protein